jgi:adenine/guanine phosphoribosyltransferase-like PRPP-binding protein
MHHQPGQRVFIVDDLLGSGTTMQVRWISMLHFHAVVSHLV